LKIFQRENLVSSGDALKRERERGKMKARRGRDTVKDNDSEILGSIEKIQS